MRPDSEEFVANEHSLFNNTLGPPSYSSARPSQSGTRYLAPISPASSCHATALCSQFAGHLAHFTGGHELITH